MVEVGASLTFDNEVGLVLTMVTAGGVDVEPGIATQLNQTCVAIL